MTDLREPPTAAARQLEMLWPTGRVPEPVTVDLDGRYRLREGAAGDDEGWCALMARAGFAGWDPSKLAAWKECFLSHGWWFVEEVADGRLVATSMSLDRASGRHRAGGEMGWIAADPAHAGRGLGLAVSAAATRSLLASDRRPIYLLTDDERLPALRTYLRLGYVPHLYAPEMAARWRAVFAALGLEPDSEGWIDSTAPGMSELVADDPLTIRLVGPSSHAPRFVDPPTFRWQPVPDATSYRIRVADEEAVIDDQVLDEPAADLRASWPRLVDGPVDVLIQGFRADGSEHCTGVHRRFWKVPGFDGVRQEPLDWRGAARRNVAYLLAPARDEVRPYEVGLPRSCWSSFEDSISGERYLMSYPALHHPSYIMAFLLFAATFPADELAAEAVRQAVQFGEWLLEHHHADDWTCSGFPYSTISHGVYEGGNEGQAITLVRAARVGEAMVALHGFDGDPRWLDYARRIARVLVERQRPDGSWPYRVDPQSGDVVEAYSSNAITPARLFAMLEAVEPDEALRTARERALGWLLDNPVRTGLWQGMYEDIREHGPYENLEHWDVNELVRYLAHARSEHADAATVAIELNRFVEDQFVVWGRERSPVFVQCPTPLVLEQYACYHPMDVHTANWLLSLAALHLLTDDETYLDRGIAAANALVRSQQPHGAFSNWGLDRRFGRPLQSVDWASCNACTVSGLLRWSAYVDAVGAGEPRELGLWGI